MGLSWEKVAGAELLAKAITLNMQKSTATSIKVS